MIAGTVERIGTGQKRIFATGSELLRILAPVASLLHNMPYDDLTGKKESGDSAYGEDGFLRSAATEEPRMRSDSDPHLEP